MASSAARRVDKLVVDSIHGDIHLSEVERRVIDTASFQRLRHLKQLGMAHVTYPNATHTRFAHSIGVLGIMARNLKPDELQENIRMFVDGKVEPVSVVDIPHSLTHLCSNHFYQAIRLYLVPDNETSGELVECLRGEVASW